MRKIPLLLSAIFHPKKPRTFYRKTENGEEMLREFKLRKIHDLMKKMSELRANFPTIFPNFLLFTFHFPF